MKTSSSLLICAVLYAVVGCSKQEEQAASAPPASSAATEPAALDPIQSALNASDRFAGDAGEDAWRKSNEVLTFVDLKPGMHVLDYFAGGGYYTELFSRVVGPDGRIYAYNNAEYAKYAGDKPAQRYANQRLPNVVEVGGPPEQLAIEPETIDVVFFNQAYHDLRWRSKKCEWPNTDAAQSLAQVVKAMKPGATAIVIDHVAAAGCNPDESVDTLLRIDPEVVNRDFAAAGLELATESELLANPDDDHTKLVFDAAVSHKTDQFIFKFKKP